MVRLRTLRLENFMSHEESEVEFDPCLTVITGTNDAGKTSLLRAARGVLRVENWPPGDDETAGVIRRGQKQAVVLAVLDRDGERVMVGRTRERSKNRLVLQVGDGEIETYSTVRDIAGRVQEATGFTLCEVDEGQWEDMNFSLVDTSRFLLGGQRPDTLLRRTSRLLGGQRLGESLRVMQRKLQQAQTQHQAAAADAEREAGLVERMAEPSQQVTFGTQLVEQWGAALVSTEAARSRLGGLRQRRGLLSPILAVPKLRGEVETVQAAGRRAMEASNLASRYQGLADQWARVRVLPAGLLPELKAQLGPDGVGGHLALASDAQARRRSLVNVGASLDGTRRLVQSAAADQWVVQEEIVALRQRRMELLKELGRCPTCGRDMT